MNARQQVVYDQVGFVSVLPLNVNPRGSVTAFCTVCDREGLHVGGVWAPNALARKARAYGILGKHVREKHPVEWVLASALVDGAKVLVTWRDPGGMPRAWATGHAAEADVRERAWAELVLYCLRESVRAEGLRERDFTEHVERVREEANPS